MHKRFKNLPPVQSFFRSDDDVASQPVMLVNRTDQHWSSLLQGRHSLIASAVSLPDVSHSAGDQPLSIEKEDQRPKIPKGPPQQWTPAAMIERVRVGMMVELSTIPLYLYGMYSIIPGRSNASSKLRDILEQEMLHLALVGNLLSALGGSLDLYDPKVVPRYPGRILMDEIPMTLRVLDAESLGYLVKIESPDDGHQAQAPQDPTILAKDYNSIGDLYEDVIKGVNDLPDATFAHNQGKQFKGDPFFGKEELYPITNKSTARQALELIIEQGEGNKDTQDSHHQLLQALRLIELLQALRVIIDKGEGNTKVLQELEHVIEQREGNTETQGPHHDVLQALRLIVEKGEENKEALQELKHISEQTQGSLRGRNTNPWEVHPVPEDPQTVDYDSGSYIHKLSLAFDAAYCYLLQNIQRVWRTNENVVREALIRNIGDIMRSVLTPLAKILLEQTQEGGVAAPCFNYYAMTGDVGANLVKSPTPLTPEVLHAQLSNRMQDAVNAAPDAQQKSNLGSIKYNVDRSKPSE